LHPIVRKAFPSFGERDVAEPARVSKEGAVLRVMHGRRVLRRVRFGKLFGNVIPIGVEESLIISAPPPLNCDSKRCLDFA